MGAESWHLILNGMLEKNAVLLLWFTPERMSKFCDSNAGGIWEVLSMTSLVPSAVKPHRARSPKKMCSNLSRFRSSQTLEKKLQHVAAMKIVLFFLSEIRVLLLPTSALGPKVG